MSANTAKNVGTTRHEKSFLQKAAELFGFSILATDPNITSVSLKDWKNVDELISNPEQPNPYLKELMSSSNVA